MIRRDTDYAMRLLVHVAASPGEAATAGAMAKAQGVPVGFAQKILRKLAVAGILRAKPGRGGGFALAKAPGELPLSHVIESLQGPLLLNQCMKSPQACSRRPTCPVTGHLRRVQDTLDEFFETTTLADVLVAPKTSARRAATASRRDGGAGRRGGRGGP